jgi:transcriptional regulator with XRE-family HTH domain
MIATALRRDSRRPCVPETPTYFARKLTEFREAAGVSTYRLAQLTGITRQALALLESGRRVPTWDTVQRLALALGVDCTAFIDPGLQLPEAQPPKKAGRPRKATEPDRPERKKKGKAK